MLEMVLLISTIQMESRLELEQCGLFLSILFLIGLKGLSSIFGGAIELYDKSLIL